MAFELTSVPEGALDIVQVVLDFAPGAFTPPHTHSGPTFVTVLDGQVTRREGGTEATFQPGQGWMEPGIPHAAGNATASGARVLVTALIPRGAAFTTVQASGAAGELPPGPSVAAQFRAELPTPPSLPADLIHVLLEFAPGAFTPAHTHGGPTYVTVLTGTMSRRADGAEEVFRTGQTWIEPGIPHAAGNRTQIPATVGVAFVLPKGHPATHVAQVPHARDGLSLPLESFATRATFHAVWGDAADERWVQEHNAALVAAGR